MFTKVCIYIQKVTSMVKFSEVRKTLIQVLNQFRHLTHIN